MSTYRNNPRVIDSADITGLLSSTVTQDGDTLVALLHVTLRPGAVILDPKNEPYAIALDGIDPKIYFPLVPPPAPAEPVEPAAPVEQAPIVEPPHALSLNDGGVSHES